MKGNAAEENYRGRIARMIISLAAGLVFLAVYIIAERKEFSFMWIVPAGLMMVLLALLSIDKFLILIVFLVPLSVQLRFILPGTGFDLFLPTEPMLALIMILFFFKSALTSEIDRKLFTHPVSLVALLILAWGFLTSLTGTMPLVSLKSMTARLWFITGFYFLAMVIFTRRKMIITYFTAYIAGLTPVVIWFVYNMQESGLFLQKASYTAVRPFFNDHTAIGASLAFCIPVIIYLLFRKGTSGIKRFLLFLLLSLFSFAFILSYSRAAWISLAIAAIVFLVLRMRISWKIVLPVLTGGLIIAALSWQALIMKLGENRQDSSAKISRHIQSISNITTDASNMERINRWKSALRMSAEKPLLGWGPGTYQFRYAPYQMASEKTIISTNWGEGGNVHSEYLGSLVDSGIPGLLLYLALFILILVRAVIIYKRQTADHSSCLMLALIAGIVTYAVHGGLNNFLDTDKISALFWGMAAAVAAFDLKFPEGISGVNQ